MIEVGMLGNFPIELKNWRATQDGTWAAVERAGMFIGGIFRPHGESWWQVVTYKQLPSRTDPDHIINIRDKQIQVAALDDVFEFFR